MTTEQFDDLRNNDLDITITTNFNKWLSIW